MNWRDHIECHPWVFCGKPVFRGTRDLVYVVIDDLRRGMSDEEILRGCFVRISSVQLEAVRAYARENEIRIEPLQHETVAVDVLDYQVIAGRKVGEFGIRFQFQLGELGFEAGVVIEKDGPIEYMQCDQGLMPLIELIHPSNRPAGWFMGLVLELAKSPGGRALPFRLGTAELPVDGEWKSNPPSSFGALRTP